MDAAETLRIGLRFRRSQRRPIKALIEKLESMRPDNIDIGLYHKALDAATTGEPLVVYASTRDQVEAMADQFVVLGLGRPALEELSG